MLGFASKPVLQMLTQNLFIESLPPVLPRSHWAELGSQDRIRTSVCICRCSSERCLNPEWDESRAKVVRGLGAGVC